MTEQERTGSDEPQPAPAPETPPAAPEAPAAAPAAEAPAEETPPATTAPAAEAPAAGQPEARPAGERREERGPSERRDERGGERRRRHFGRRKVCSFCVEKATAIDYKDPVKLRRYLSDRARIEPRRKTGTCAKHQRWLALALKRARYLALLPYTPEHMRLTGTFAGRR